MPISIGSWCNRREDLCIIDDVILAINRTEQRLALGWHHAKLRGVRLPLVPLAADGVVAVEDGDAVAPPVGPRRARVSDRLGEEQHRARRARISLPERRLRVLDRRG